MLQPRKLHSLSFLDMVQGLLQNDGRSLGTLWFQSQSALTTSYLQPAGGCSSLFLMKDIFISVR